MKIGGFRTEKIGDRVRVSAQIVWEDCGRAPQELYFETDRELTDSFHCNPHAFLIACTLPAFHFKEKRIFMDAEICPDLQDGLITVMCWMRYWGRYKRNQELLKIEVKTQSKVPDKRMRQRAGLFFSGGIDSLATLKANHENYDEQHPNYIRDGLLVYGLEVSEPEKFDLVINSVAAIARDAGITLLPVSTNIRDMGPKNTGAFWGGFWLPEYQGAVWASIAHCFSKRFSTVFLSSDRDIPNMVVSYGNHPLINANYSSCDLSIKYWGITLSRYEKTKLIATWETGLKHLRVCNNSRLYKSGALNCGECEKCIRTKLALLALGRLDKAQIFANNDISAELVKSIGPLADVAAAYYNKDLFDALDARGYRNITCILKRKLRRNKAKHKMRKMLIEKVKTYDELYLNQKLLKIKRSVSARKCHDKRCAKGRTSRAN